MDGERKSKGRRPGPKNLFLSVDGIVDAQKTEGRAGDRLPALDVLTPEPSGSVNVLRTLSRSAL
jgi:hypothetical protein